MKKIFWIIKNLLIKINIHPLNYLFFFLTLISGFYLEFIVIFSLIIIHEFGHFLSAFFLKWNIKKIDIYPFGGCVKFEEIINKPIFEEIIILVSGPLLQYIFYLFIYLLFKSNFITLKLFLLFKTYNYTLLIFNLLFIYPLDGGKLLNLVLYYLLPYKISNYTICIISLFNILLIFIFYNNINIYFMGLFLIFDILIYFKRNKYLYNKFLLERYLNIFNFKKRKIIKNKELFYKDKKHIIYYDMHYLSEKNYLNKRFGGLNEKNI